MRSDLPSVDTSDTALFTAARETVLCIGRSLVSLYPPNATENMGATGSTGKRYPDQYHSNIYSTPPKLNTTSVHNRLVHLQCDPRSPTGKTWQILRTHS